LLTVEPITMETRNIGLAVAERHHLSRYNAMIAAAALQAGCEIVGSKEMQDGMAMGERLRISNPFLIRSSHPACGSQK